MTAEEGSVTTQRDATFALVVLFAVSLFNHIDRTILSILQVPLKRDLALSDLQLGALTGLSFAVVYCTLAIPMSRIADRVVRKRLMAGALALWSGMTIASGFATSYITLVLCRMGVAWGESSCSPTTLSLISDYYPAPRRALPIAIWATSVSVGTMMGVSGGGWLTEALGWRGAFVAVGLVGLALAPVVLCLKEPMRGQFDGAARDQPRPSMAAALGILWRSRAYRFLVLGASFQSYVLCSAQLWGAPFYVRVYGMGLGEVGLWLALLFGVGGGLGALAGGQICNLWAARDPRYFAWLPAAAAVLLVPFALVQYLSDDVRVALAAGFVTAALTSFYLAPLNACTQSLVQPRMRAFTSAVILLFTNLVGLGLGPLVTGAISDAFESQYGDESVRFALCATLPIALLAALAFQRAARHLTVEL